MTDFDANALFQESRRRQAEIDHFLERYGDQFIDLRTLLALARTLIPVNWAIFGIVAWIAFGSLSSPLGDTRPAWVLWFLAGPLTGLFFGGIASIAWLVFAHFFGEWVLKIQGRSAGAFWWHRYLGHVEPENLTHWTGFRQG